MESIRVINKQNVQNVPNEYDWAFIAQVYHSMLSQIQFSILIVDVAVFIWSRSILLQQSYHVIVFAHPCNCHIDIRIRCENDFVFQSL